VVWNKDKKGNSQLGQWSAREDALDLDFEF
jgi:hypothetical protein